jgi:hypothetical protein
MLLTVGNFGSLNPLGTYAGASQVGPFVSAVISLITILAGLYFLWQLALAGLGMASSGGDEKDLTKARKALGGALTGFVICVASYFIVGYVATTTGFPTIFSPSISGLSGVGCIAVSKTIPTAYPEFDYEALLFIKKVQVYKSQGHIKGGQTIKANVSFNKNLYDPNDAIDWELYELRPTGRFKHYPTQSGLVGNVPPNGCLSM